MFSDTQKAALAAPLGASHVKSRNQGGRNVSYVEGWHAIAEANRIFGFDAWSRETVEIKCVAEKDREIGGGKAPGFGVTYIAKVRVRVGDIIREGCGTGHGIDRDLGQAHESALKEAETDAMKRALMTFGNPFGLALYDKTQANVCDERDERPQKPVTPLLGEPEASKVKDQLIEDIKGCATADELDAYIKSDLFKTAVGRLPEKHRGHVRTAFSNRFPKDRAA
jgi:DNA recombination protein Rad52